MIPKIIHYCWFGGKEIPEKDKKCIESWKKYCPDYEIVEWNETNYDVNKHPYMAGAYKAKKWGFVPDYARFDIIYEHGGIYMDTDVEIIKPLDELLKNKAYMGFEEGNFVNGGIGFGAEKGNEIIKKLRDMYDSVQFVLQNGKLNMKPSPYYISEELEKMGLVRNNKMQLIKDMKIYPIEYFSPKELSTNRLTITKNTYTIHHYNASWLSQKDLRSIKIQQRLFRVFGKKNGKKIWNFVVCLKDNCKKIIKSS